MKFVYCFQFIHFIIAFSVLIWMKYHYQYMLDKQNNNKFVQKNIYFPSANFKQMSLIQQIDILENPKQIDDKIHSPKIFYGEGLEQIQHNPNFNDQNLKFIDSQNGKLQNEIFEMMDEIQNDFTKERLQSNIKELQQNVKTLQNKILQKDTIATKLLHISTKQNLLIRKKLISINNIITTLKDSEIKIQNIEKEMIQLEQKYFNLTDKCLQKDRQIEELMKGLEPKATQLFQVQTQKIISAQSQTQTFLVETQSVGICVDLYQFCRLTPFEAISIIPNKQQMQDTLFQNDMKSEYFSSQKQFLQNIKLFPSKSSSLAKAKTLSIIIEPFPNNYQTKNNEIKGSSKNFKISNEYSLNLAEVIDINYAMQTEATEAEECFQQFSSFDVFQPLISIILMLNEAKQIQNHEGIIQKLLTIKNNKISQVLTKLLKEHKFLKICLDRMIENDSQRDEEINSKIQIVYSNVTNHKKTVPIHEEVNESSSLCANEKKQQKECQIY